MDAYWYRKSSTQISTVYLKWQPRKSQLSHGVTDGLTHRQIKDRVALIRKLQQKYKRTKREDRISLENLRLATELPDSELRKTLWSLVAFPKLKRQVLHFSPAGTKYSEWDENTVFWVNHEFGLIKNGKVQKRGRINLIGRLQLSTEKAREEENEGIIQLRILRTQEAIRKILKMRKCISNAQLQTELVDILKNMFLPSKKLIKEQIEWLIENKYMKRDETDINTFIYIA